jgi:hypothetical protein
MLVASLAVAAAAVAGVGVAAATLPGTSAAPSGVLATLVVRDPATHAPTRYLIWRSQDGTLFAAAPASDPGHYVALVRGERLDAAYAGEDFAYTYHAAARAARELDRQLVGMTPGQVARALSAGHSARQPGWIAPALAASRHPDQLVDDWGFGEVHARGFARAHPGAWWMAGMVFGHTLLDLQSVSGTRAQVPVPYLTANYTAGPFQLSVQTDHGPTFVPYDPHRLVAGGRTFACGFDQADTPHATICVTRIGGAQVEVWGKPSAPRSWWRNLLPILQPLRAAP